MIARLAFVQVFLLVLGALPTPASARIDSIVVHADRVAFYSNRLVVTANGNVRIRFTDGTTVTGREFAMDLKLNRFIIAGNVTLTSGNYRYEGAAFSEFLDFRRGYFLPVGDDPDRWTFINEDYIPARGREMPGDAFFLPDISDHPFVTGKTARITPKVGVSLSPAHIYTLGAYVPAPDYYYNFSANPNFAQNSLNGSTGDVPYPFAGSNNATTVLHLRYDSVQKFYLGIEQHLVSDHAYAVFSINPLTRPQKQYNFLGSVKTGNNRFQLTSFDQVSSFQHGFSQPWSSSAFENLQLTYALRNSYLQLNGNQYQTSLLAQPQPDANGALWYGDPGHPWIPNHPNNFQLAWVGADQHLRFLPVNYRLRTGIFTAHDSYGLGSFVTTPYESLWQHFVGFTVWTNPIKLTPGPSERALNLQVTYDRQRTMISSFPRYQEQANTTGTLSEQFNRRIGSYLSYIISNQGDYLGANQPVFYPSTVLQNPYDGKTYPGWAAFDGFATFRDLQLGLIFTPTPYFSFTLQGDRHQDFPAPIPFYYGNPPYSLTMRTQFRVNPRLSLTIARSYYFNFGNMGWSPTFSVQVGP